MFILIENLQEFQNFPEPLRKLVEEELRAGNQIMEFGHGFPAAPCGAYIKLAAPVSSRERVATLELDFYDRDSSNYSGEFTDANRHYFVLEPPHPPKPAPDTNAIRAVIDAEYAALSDSRTQAFDSSNENVAPIRMPRKDRNDDANRPDSPPASVVARFVKSMEMTYDKWREGEGYDLALIEEADESSRDSIEKIVIQNNPLGWRDIEALAMIGSPRGRAAILDAYLNADTQTRMAVHRYAPELLTETLRTDSILRALRESEIYYGLSETLDEIEDFHPPEVIQEMLRGLMKRDGATACHFAAMLFYLHGRASSAFDWDHRPFFLKFNTDNLIEREKATRELCEVIGVDPAICISTFPNHG
ncbi:MAG: hypothetical protein ABL921_10550 [Pirellula sp.]